MNGTFDDATREINRLMEVAGGSANAYDDAPVTTPEPAPLMNKPAWDEVVGSLATAFRDGNLFKRETPSAEDGAVAPASDEPTPEEMRDFWKEFHTYPKDTKVSAEESEREFEKRELESCGSFLNDAVSDEAPNPQLALSRIPRPIAPDYRYVGSVENAGELFGLYNSFRDVLSGRPPHLVALDSGEYEIFALGDEFILEDKVKGFRYQSDSSKERAPTTSDVFIWVAQINGNFFDKIGYIVNESVFVRR